MPDTPLGLTYPTNLGSAELWTHLQTLAETSDDAIQVVADSVDTAPPTAVDEAALASIVSPDEGMHVWVEDQGLFFAYDGAAWVADRRIYHYSRRKAIAVAVAAGGTFAVVTWDELGYDRASVFEYGSPLTLGHFKYVGPFNAMVYTDIVVQWEDNSTETRELRTMRSIDNGATWQQFDVVVVRGAISMLMHGEMYMEPGHLLRVEAANNHSSTALDIGGAISANRIRMRAEKY